MKKILLSSLVLAAFAFTSILFQMTSCKKAEAQTTTPGNFPIEGLWVGTYTVDGQPGLGNQFFSFSIKPDGTMVNDTKGAGQQHLAPGTWSLTGTTLTCTFTCVYGTPANVGVTEATTLTWDKTGKLTGTWRNVPASGTGTITLTRIN